MTRLLPLALLPLLAACADGAPLGLPFGSADAGATADEGPVPVPPEVAPYLPPGVPGTLVMRDANGCYLFTIEETDPPSGFPVRDSHGNQVCPAGEGA
ncbi:MAG: hypothetical protein H3C51_08060 [Rubellimicrobium sp.]|nr:hypothetical protein [Rubellimicrobium sp.]